MSLIGWWPLHETSGTTAYDLSGNGNNGTLSGGVTQNKTGVRGSTAYYFDGTDDEVNIGDLAIFEPSRMSIAAWFKADDPSLASLQNIVGKGGGGAPDSWRFGINQGEVLINFTEINAASGGDLEPGKWHHAVGTYDENGAYIYLDGELVGISLGSVDVSSGDQVRIGNDEAGNRFAGNIQDVRIYDHVLTPLEIEELYKQGAPHDPRLEKSPVDVTSGLVSRYTMDNTEVSSTTLTDVAGSNNGTINGATTGLPGIDGGEAFRFDNTDDYIDIGAPLNFSGAQNFTASAWFKNRDNDGNDYIIGSGVGNGWYIRFDSGSTGADGGLIFKIDDTTNSTYFGTNKAYDDGKWHLATLVNDGSYLIGYVDGKLIGSQPHSVGDISNTTNIGRDVETADAETYFGGEIDEVRIYDRALTQDEINTLYRNFNPYSKSHAVTEPNRLSNGGVARYSMDDADVSGSTLTDTWGNNDGTINGATTGIPGVGNGESFSFDGTDDDVEFSLNIDSFTEYTFSLWVKTTQDPSISSQQYVGGWVLMGTGEDAGFGETYIYNQDSTVNTPGGAAFRVGDGSDPSVDVYGTSKINDGEWHHIAATAKENQLIRLFVDGVEEDSASIGTFGNPSSIFAMARKVSTNEHGWTGKIDEVRIYNRELTATEIWMLYNQGKRLIPEIVNAK